MKRFDENYVLVKDMYDDGYFPNFLVDKIKSLILNLIAYLEMGEQDITKIQEKCDDMTLSINDLDEEFDENDSELETLARESIGDSVEYVLKWFEISIDCEEAIRNREW